MGITFEDHLLAYAAFVRWCAVARWMLDRTGPARSHILIWLRSFGQIRSWQLGLLALALTGLYLSGSNPVFTFQNALFLGHRPALAYCFLAAVAAIAYLAYAVATIVLRAGVSTRDRIVDSR